MTPATESFKMGTSLRIRKVFIEGVFKRFPKQMFTNGGFLMKVSDWRILKDTSTVQSVMKTSLANGFPYHFASVN